jgi:hypothetical protein
MQAFTTKFWVCLSAGLGCATLAALTARAAPNELEELRVGFVNGDYFFSCIFDDGGSILVPDTAKLEKRNLEGRLTATYRIPLHILRPDFGFRWHIGGDCVWATGQGATVHLDSALRVPLRELNVYDSNIPPRPGGSKPTAVPRSQMIHLWNLSPASDLPAAGIGISRISDGIPKYQPPGEVCYDIIPTSEESCVLFVLNDRQMRVFEGNGRVGHKSVVFGYGPQYKQLSRFQVGFQKPFWVFGNRDTFIFITKSRKMYLAKRGGAPDSVKVLWKNGDWPVVAAVVDVAADTTFFLAQETAVGGGRKCLRVDKDGQLAETVVDPMKMKRLPFSRPLETCVPFAQYLHAEGLLTEKRP